MRGWKTRRKWISAPDQARMVEQGGLSAISRAGGLHWRRRNEIAGLGHPMPHAAAGPERAASAGQDDRHQ